MKSITPSIQAPPKTYRMPAEWEPHAGSLLTWPHSRETWPGRLDEAAVAFAAMTRAIAPGETVHILVLDEQHEARARQVLRRHEALAPNVVFHRIPTNDSWIRDYGPIFLRDARPGSPLIALDWEFNTWGGKYPPWDNDNAATGRLLPELGIGVSRLSPGLVLEGGSIEVNGDGLLMTTEQCVLNPNRNPELSREEIEETLRLWFRVEKVLWLGDGIDGDDTDGHVDDLARFVSRDTIVTAVEIDDADVNYQPLRENLERLRRLTDQRDQPFTILELPMPELVEFEGRRLPASYANYYVCNAAVLVPVFDCPERDRAACETLARCFPDREIAPIPARDLVIGLGACHCLSQQIPRPD